MMKATVVRYQAKPERAEENQRLIEAVFAELDEREPDGFTYKVFRLEDGVSFVHVVIEHDIADPDSRETSYDKTPLRPLVTMLEAAGSFAGKLGNISCPTLILTSRNDHVVPPENSDILAEAVSGPVEREWYDRSYHVITLDYDKEAVEQRVVEFAKRVTAD